MSRMRRVTASGSSIIRPTGMMPALLTSTSIGPSWRSTSSRNSENECGSVTSSLPWTSSPSAAPDSLTHTSSMSPIATLAPKLCSAVAVANPIPRAPPVITMTLSRTFRPTAVSAMFVLPQGLNRCQLCNPVSTALEVGVRNKHARSAQGQPGQARGPDQGAVDGERCQGARLKVPGEIAHGEIGADEGRDAAGQDLPADAASQRSKQFRDFVHPGGQDDGRCQQEGEPGGVFVGQAAP